MSWRRPSGVLLSSVDGLVDRVLCILGAVLFSQLPEFIQQYLQRLGGHLDEARRHLGQFQDVATRSGLSLDQLIRNAQASLEPGLSRLGGVIQETVTRVGDLMAAEAAIRSASNVMRPFVFVRYVDLPMAKATWAAFKFAVPVTLEGLAYAAAGMLVALVLYHGLVRYPLRRLFHRRERLVYG